MSKVANLLGWILSKFVLNHIFTLYRSCVSLQQTAVNHFKYSEFRCSSSVLFTEPAKYIIQLESQSISLDDSGKPVSSVNFHRSSSNLQLHLGGYLSPPTREQALHCRVRVQLTSKIRTSLDFEQVPLVRSLDL